MGLLGSLLIDPIRDLLGDDSEDEVGLAAGSDESREVNPKKELEELQRAYRSYTNSSIYDGDPVTWVDTEFGLMPVGGYTAQGPSADDDRSNSLWRDYTAARTNIYDRALAQDKYGGGYHPVFNPSTFLPDSDLSQDEIAGRVRGYLEGTAEYDVPEQSTPTAQPGMQQAIADQLRGTPTARMDFSQSNPFLDRARNLGFTEYQEPSSSQINAVAEALRGDDRFAGGGGRYLIPPSAAAARRQAEMRSTGPYELKGDQYAGGGGRGVPASAQSAALREG